MVPGMRRRPLSPYTFATANPCKQRTWSSVLAYPVLKTVLVIVQIITQYFGVYCENSFSPHHAHLYLTIIDYLFVGGALGATIRFFRRMVKEISPVHKPRPKIWSFLGIFSLSDHTGSDLPYSCVYLEFYRNVFRPCTNITIVNGKLFSPTKDRNLQRYKLRHCLLHDMHRSGDLLSDLPLGIQLSGIQKKARSRTASAPDLPNEQRPSAPFSTL